MVEEMRNNFLNDLLELENDAKTLLNRIKQARKDIKKAQNEEELRKINEKYGDFDNKLKFIRIFG